MGGTRSAVRVRTAGLLSVLTVLAVLPALAGTPGTAAAGPRCPAGAGNAGHRPGKAPYVSSWLHSCPDGSIRTAKGKKIRLEGLEFFGMSAGAPAYAKKCQGPYYFPQPYVGQDIRKWGFNEVSLFISWQNLEPQRPTKKNGRVHDRYDGAYLRGLDAAIQQFRKAHVAVVLVGAQGRWSAAFQHIDAGNVIYPCGRGMPAWIYQNEIGAGALAMVHAEDDFYNNRTRVWDAHHTVSEPIQRSYLKAWKFLAHRYRHDRTVVGMIPMWEPYDILTRDYTGASAITPKKLHLARFFDKVGSALHRVNPRLLVNFGEQRSSTTQKWSLLRRPRVPNGVMASEFYAAHWATDGRERMLRYVGRAHHWHYPFYIDEFDAFGKTRNKPRPDWKTSLGRMLAYCKKHQVSWTLLSYGAVHTSDVHQARPDLIRVLRRHF